MIIWSGRGFLSILVLGVTIFLFVTVLPTEQADWAFVVGLFVAAAFSWIMGKRWNEKEGRIVIDKATGQEVMIKPNHSIFWIKMQYWGIIFTIFGIIILIQQFT